MSVLTDCQRGLMEDFYKGGPRRVIYTKAERSELWNKTKRQQGGLDLSDIRECCPALAHQISKSYLVGKNIQSAVFSECVYAQTLATMFGLEVFGNCLDGEDLLPGEVTSLLTESSLRPRYYYSDSAGSRFLVQAGGHGGVDCAFIINNRIVMIEFKEPGAKTSEVDLPKYGEDGVLNVTRDFLNEHPQFEVMLQEQEGLGFFDSMGNNVHNFSDESVNRAISGCYSGADKFADVICTEDKDGFLTMFPPEDILKWAHVEGEIRPAGRNPYAVWTPLALRKILCEKGAIVNGTHVTMRREMLETCSERGGNGGVSRYKINPIFFVRAEVCCSNDSTINFEISDVRQLKPTIAGKMFFRNLDYDEVLNFYQPLLA